MNTTSPNNADDYSVKPHAYFEQERTEMLSFVPQSASIVLDVGCGDGSFGALLRKARGITVWGVEPFELAAEQAKEKLDRVICSGFDPSIALSLCSIDCIVFNDVLEHLIDPLAALKYATELLKPDGTIVASIPNIRHFPTMWRLSVHGEWKYRDCGTLDKTHMRFFTRSSIISMFQEAGLQITRMQGIHAFRGIPNVSSRVWKLYHLLNTCALNKLNDLRYERYALVAIRGAREMQPDRRRQ